MFFPSTKPYKSQEQNIGSQWFKNFKNDEINAFSSILRNYQSYK